MLEYTEAQINLITAEIEQLDNLENRFLDNTTAYSDDLIQMFKIFKSLKNELNQSFEKGSLNKLDLFLNAIDIFTKAPKCNNFCSTVPGKCESCLNWLESSRESEIRCNEITSLLSKIIQ
ncbi:MAG: hypothetical protein HOP31_02555 [Ignavibacteria bacterium]|nr:hypothetical protein [Ignavibacteria bacterium]